MQSTEEATCVQEWDQKLCYKLVLLATHAVLDDDRYEQSGPAVML